MAHVLGLQQARAFHVQLQTMSVILDTEGTQVTISWRKESLASLKLSTRPLICSFGLCFAAFCFSSCLCLFPCPSLLLSLSCSPHLFSLSLVSFVYMVLRTKAWFLCTRLVLFHGTSESLSLTFVPPFPPSCSLQLFCASWAQGLQ